MEKYGFIYLWYDKKQKKFYLGRHWGRINDSYICSSNKMRDAYRRRPQDFKRRILKKIFTSNEDLIIEEQRWLDMIKPSECGKKYYNKTLKATAPSMRGHKHSQESIRKIKEGNKGRIVSDETKKILSEYTKKQFSTEESKKKHAELTRKMWLDPNFRAKIAATKAANRAKKLKEKEQQGLG